MQAKITYGSQIFNIRKIEFFREPIEEHWCTAGVGVVSVSLQTQHVERRVLLKSN